MAIVMQERTEAAMLFTARVLKRAQKHHGVAFYGISKHA
jgi:hypothetical protein